MYLALRSRYAVLPEVPAGSTYFICIANKAGNKKATRLGGFFICPVISQKSNFNLYSS